MAKRSYSDEQKASALAALAANGGNVNLTSGQIGVPRHTLLKWAFGEGAHTSVTDIGHQKKQGLADRLVSH